MAVLDRSLLAGSTLDAAQALLGCRLVRAGEAGGPRRVGRIVEVEAYIGEDDRACHARFGRTARNAIMYGAPGHAYVYLVYGMYDCLNVVTEPPGRPAAVLVRAVEPIEGADVMRAARLRLTTARRRGAVIDRDREASRLARLPASRLASGPGLVAAAFGLVRADTGLDLCDPGSPVRLEAPPPDETPPAVVATPRVGIGYAGPPWTEVRWRYLVRGHPSVSGQPRVGR